MGTANKPPAPQSGPAHKEQVPPHPDSDQVLAELAELRREISSLRTEVQRHLQSQSANGQGDQANAVWPRSADGRTVKVKSLPNRLESTRLRISRHVGAWRRESEWTPPHPLAWDITLILAITIIAWWIRSVDLTTVPPGLHGDEAATGLEARRILEQGWIGVYTGMAGGNPTGFYYLDALLFKFVDNPILAVRLLSP